MEILLCFVFLQLLLAVVRASDVDATASVCNITTSVLVTDDRDSTDCLAAGQGRRYQCGSLQIALELVANADNADDGCMLIEMHPGVHSLYRNVSITRNVVIRGSSGTQVMFNIHPSLLAGFSPIEPLPLLSFKHAHQLHIEDVAFSESPGFIQIENVTEITLVNLTFRYFLQGAVNVYNFHNLTVLGCLFEHNGPASFVDFANYRGYCGGLSVSLDSYISQHQTHTLLVRDVIFKNNSALPDEQATRSSSQVFDKFVFTGRGGAFGIFLGSDNGTLKAEVSDCVFEENSALLFGGAMYIVFHSASKNSSVTVCNCLFRRNQCRFSSGALFGGFFGVGTPTKHSTLTLQNLVFIENSAQQGGSVAVSTPGSQGQRSHNRVRFKVCTFLGNTAREFGAAISLNTLDPIEQLNYVNATQFIDCKFINNSSPQGATIGIVFVPISFHGYNIFDGNEGGAIQIAGSLVDVHGNLDILNHRTIGSPDGAVSVTSSGQLVMHRGTRINFINNTGEVGAAISIESEPVPDVYSKLVYNPLCFLRYEDYIAAPDDWDDVEIYFGGNSASEASVGVVHQLNLCSWVSFSDPYFNPSRILKWNFVKFSENTDSFHAHDPTNPKFYIYSDAVMLDIHNKSISVYPGELINLKMTVFDELNRTMGATVRLEDYYNNHIRFLPAALIYQIEDYPLQTRLLLSANQTYSKTYHSAIATAFLSEMQPIDVMAVSIRPCPPGHVLKDEFENSTFQFVTCQCSSEINPAILTCENERIQFVDTTWATKDPTQEDSLFVHPCPPGYCRCELGIESKERICIHGYHHEEPDDQCACGRKGILCGECSNSQFGVSVLLNRCVTCHDAFGLLILVLVIADVSICIVLLKFFLESEYPAWIFPCVFYIQVLPYITEHFKEAFGLLRPLLYYISSALSFYFLFDFCLYSNMSALVSYTLRFIPVVLVSVTTIIYLTISWKCFRKWRSKHWHMVWLLLILIYTHTVHTSMSILNCPSVPFNGTQAGHWFVAGHVTCFTGGHAALGVFAIVVLVLCALVIPISFILSVYQIESIRWLQRLSEPAGEANFKDEYRWWYSVELVRRFLLVLMTVPFPQNNYPSLFTQCVMMAIFLYTQPYISTAANIAEAILSTSTIILLLLSLRVTQNQFPIVIGRTNSTCSSDNSIITLNTWLWTVFYYVPLIVTVALIGLSLVMLIRRKIRIKYKKKASRRRPPRQTIELHRDPNKTMIVDMSKIWKNSLNLQIEQDNNGTEPITQQQESQIN